jgi:hypothetical protein
MLAAQLAASQGGLSSVSKKVKDKQVTGQFQAPNALLRRKSPQCLLARRLGGPPSRSGRCGEEKSLLLCRESNPGRPARSPLLYRLGYPDSQLLICS